MDDVDDAAAACCAAGLNGCVMSGTGILPAG